MLETLEAKTINDTDDIRLYDGEYYDSTGLLTVAEIRERREPDGKPEGWLDIVDCYYVWNDSPGVIDAMKSSARHRCSENANLVIIPFGPKVVEQIFEPFAEDMKAAFALNDDPDETYMCDMMLDGIRFFKQCLLRFEQGDFTAKYVGESLFLANQEFRTFIPGDDCD